MPVIDRLSVLYDVQDQQFRAGMERMRRTTRATSDQIIAQANRAERGLSGIGRAFAGAFSAAVVVGITQKITRIADAATQMRNALSIAGLEGEELSRVYGQLFESAQRNAAPISSLVGLYSKLALTQKELGVTSDELIQFTDGIAVALKVAGTDATAASGSLLQLSQALGGGIVRAEEFNSILEGTPTIAQAVARGLKEANGSVAELRKLVVDGEVSSKAFFRAFEAGSAELRAQAETSQTTVGQAMTRIGNSLVTLIGDFDSTTGASAGLASAIGATADAMDNFDVGGIITKLQSLGAAFRENEAAVHDWMSALANAQTFSDLNDALGISEGGQIVNPDVREAEKKIDLLEGEVGDLQAQIENNTAMGFDNTEALARLGEVRAELAAVRAEAASLPRYIAGIRQGGEVIHNMVDTGTRIDSYSPPPSPAQPVSIEDFPSDGSGGGSARRTGGRRGRSGGGGGSKKTERPFFENIEKDLLNLQREIELVGKSNEQIAEARARWELLDEAKKRGLPINEQLNAQINAQAAEVGRLTGELERAEIAQQQFDAAIDGIADAMAGALVAGESLRDGLAQVLKGIASDIINSGIRAALDSQLGGGGGWLGGVLNSFLGGGDQLTGALRRAGLPAFDGGGFTGSGSRSGGIDGKGGFPAILHPNETVVDHTRGPSVGGGSMSINVNVEGANGDQHVIALVQQGVQQGLASYDKAMPARVQQINASPRKR